LRLGVLKSLSTRSQPDALAAPGERPRRLVVDLPELDTCQLSWVSMWAVQGPAARGWRVDLREAAVGVLEGAICTGDVTTEPVAGVVPGGDRVGG